MSNFSSDKVNHETFLEFFKHCANCTQFQMPQALVFMLLRWLPTKIALRKEKQIHNFS